MTEFFLTLIVLLVVVTAMSVGVIMGRKPIKGSCGGMAALKMDTACDICGGDQAKCDEEQERQTTLSQNAKTDLAYDASRRD